MSKHEAQIRWSRAEQEKFVDRKYSRAHEWRFDGGVVVPASSALTSVPLPYSRAENVDPEEAYVAAISSCHMLVFLFLAAKDGYVVDSYVDDAVGEMTPNERGKLAVSRVTLRPEVVFSGAKVPDDAALAHLHHEAHEECYIANSVRTTIDVAGGWRHASAP